jgi:DNA-directed RNA polymerase specialized sigma24 family protein
VFDADAPSSKRAMEAMRDPQVRRRLHGFARWCTGVDANAKDLVEDALLRVLDPEDAPWPSDGTPFVVHMLGVMRQQWDRQMRKLQARLEIVDTGLARDERVPSDEPGPDAEVERRRGIAVWQSLLEQVLAEIGDKHPRARALCELGARGIDDLGDQARELGCDVEEVWLLRRTLRYHGRLAMEAWEDAERRRMEGLRAPKTEAAR